MPETRTAKLFRNGASQAVRLPAEFRFDGKEVYATRDEATGDVVLSQRPGRTAGVSFSP
jgi:antitoxin VapB